MILKYGTYSHALGSVSVTMRQERLLDQAGIVESFRHLWDIKFLLNSQESDIGDSRVDIKTKTAALEAAYNTDGQDLILYFPDGSTKSHHQLLTADTIGGVRIISGPNYETGPGELVTVRRGTITAEGIIPVAASSRHSDLVAFVEDVEFGPAGSRYGFLETPIGRPIKQRLRRFQTYTAAQRGTAVGRDSYPLIPLPLWPNHLADTKPLVSKGQPRRVGSSWKDFPISWTYMYKSAFELTGSPHIWGLTYTA